MSSAPTATADAMPSDDQRASPYQLFMVGLCLYVLAALAAQTVLDLDAEVLRILDFTDNAICLIFFCDFLRSLYRAPDRRKYMLTWGWLDLLSSIPTIDPFRWGRAARIFRILRLLRGLRAARVLSGFILERRAECAFWGTSLAAIMMMIFGSIAILGLESHAESNILDAEDAMWWSFVTITTVGYGDHYPVTDGGRLLASILMFTGIGLFGTFTAFVASAFQAFDDAGQDAEIAEIRKELSLLRESLERPSQEPSIPRSDSTS